MHANTGVKASSNCFPGKGSKIRMCMSLMFPILITVKFYRQPVAKNMCGPMYRACGKQLEVVSHPLASASLRPLNMTASHVV